MTLVWRETGAHEPGETWDGLARGETPGWLAPLSTDEVCRAFEEPFGARATFRTAR